MLVEFKLHNGKVPYFIKSYLSYKVKKAGKENNDRYLGVTTDSKEEYIPKSLIEITKEEFIELFKTAKITKETDEKSVELTDDKKEEIAKTFLEAEIKKS